MLAASLPPKLPVPFANSGAKNAIPTASQILVTPGAASLTDGFPPLTMLALASGGVAPAGMDFNGILNLLSSWTQWQNAGGAVPYDATFSSEVGGYPAGAILASATVGNPPWINLLDGNTANPDTPGSTGWLRLGRIRLTAARTIYVATTGNDTTGAGTSALPFASLQAAWTWAADNLDLNGQQLTISVGSGTFAAGVIATGLLQGQNAAVAFVGAGLNSSIISASGATCIQAISGAWITTAGLGLTGANGIIAGYGGLVQLAGPMNFGACTGNHLLAQYGGNIGYTAGCTSYSITGSSSAHFNAGSGGVIQLAGLAITVTVAVTITYFAQTSLLALLQLTGLTFTLTGAVTGTRYLANLNGVIYTGAAGASYFPGSTAGSTALGGQYD